MSMKRINKYIIEKLKKINSKTEYVDSKELDLLNVAHSLYQFLDNTEVKSKYVNKDGFTILKNLKWIIKSMWEGQYCAYAFSLCWRC